MSTAATLPRLKSRRAPYSEDLNLCEARQAAKIAYGKEKLAGRESETETHRLAMIEFRNQMEERFPKLGVETYLMSLDGKVETLA